MDINTIANPDIQNTDPLLQEIDKQATADAFAKQASTQALNEEKQLNKIKSSLIKEAPTAYDDPREVIQQGLPIQRDALDVEAEALDILDKKKNEQIALAEQAKQKKAEQDATKLAKYKTVYDAYAKMGKAVPANLYNPEFDSALKQEEASSARQMAEASQAIIASEDAKNAREQAELQKAAQFDSKMQEIESKQINLMAEYKQAERSRQQKEDIYNKEIDRLNKEREDIAKRPYDSFWSKKSTGDKVLASLAIALGGIGAGLTGQNQNQALNIIMGAIDDDLKNQRFNKEQELEAKWRMVSAVQDKIQKLDKLTSNVAQKGQLAQVQAQLDANKLSMQRQLANNRYYEQTGEYHPALMTDEQKKEIQERGVLMPNGKIVISKVGTKEQLGKLRDSIVDGKGGLRTIDKIMELSATPGAVISPALRDEIQSLQKALAGQSRESIVGPGTMTENDRKVLMDVIGDQTKILSLSRLSGGAAKKLENVRKNAELRIRDQLQQFGIDYDRQYKSQQEKDIDTAVSRGLSRGQAISAVRSHYAKKNQNFIE